MEWHQFVKVFEGEDEGVPYYIQWATWCWHKPIWIGLPLVLLTPLLMLVDLLWSPSILLVAWSKHR